MKHETEIKNMTNFKEFELVPNQNYIDIQKLGYDVILKNFERGWSNAYLGINGEQIRKSKTAFRDNHQAVKHKKPSVAIKGSHLDKAMAKLLKKAASKNPLV